MQSRRLKVMLVAGGAASAVLFGAFPAVAATTGAPAATAPTSEQTSCWSEVSTPVAGETEQIDRSVCVNGDASALAAKVLSTYNVVVVGDPDVPTSASYAGAKKFATAAQRVALKRRGAVAAADPEPTAEPTGTPVNTPDSPDATYALGRIYKDNNYQNYSNLMTSTHSAPCKHYLFSWYNLDDYRWSQGLTSLNDDIESFKPGPDCKFKFWIDAGYKGSTWPASGYSGSNHASLDWMDNASSAMKIGG